MDRAQLQCQKNKLQLRGKRSSVRDGFDAHGKGQPRSRNDPPIEEVGKWFQQPRGVVERAEEDASVRAMLD